MINFSLNGFIKLCLLDTGEKISELQKRLTPKPGYDFYRPLQQSVHAFCDGDKEKAVKKIQSLQMTLSVNATRTRLMFFVRSLENRIPWRR